MGKLLVSGSVQSTNKLFVGSSSNDETSPGVGIHVWDIRDGTITPNSFGDQSINFYFHQEVDGDFKSIMHIKGWTGDYAAWQIAAQASNSATESNSLYFRTGIKSSWNSWHTLLDNKNYTSYTVTKTGTGASGNWNIGAKNLYYAQELSTAELLNGFNEALSFKAGYWTNSLVPGCRNGIILNMGWTSATYGAQLAIDDDPTYFIALRQKNGSGWADWKRIPMGDGTGASGTWGISITGNASYASSAGHATYLNTVAGNEIRIHNATGLTNGGSLWLGWAWADGNKTVTKDWHIGNFSGGGLANIYAANFIGAWQGNSPSAFAPASHSHSYVPISGGTMTGRLQVNNIIFSYNYSNNNNAPAFVWDKPGNHYTGVGASGTDTIKFGPVNSNGTYNWVSGFAQHWVFQGTIRPGCIILTNDQWTGYGTGDPNDLGLDKVVGRLYFRI